MWAFAKAGISLPHSAAGQYGYGTHVSYSQLQPGDLVFFDEGGGIGHVGIYAGNGTMVDAPHTGTHRRRARALPRLCRRHAPLAGCSHQHTAAGAAVCSRLFCAHVAETSKLRVRRSHRLSVDCARGVTSGAGVARHRADS